MKLAWYAASLLLVAGVGVACGGEDEAPEPSTRDRYCAAYRDFFDERASHGAETTESEVVATLKGWGRDLEAIGIPDDMPAEARAGHDIWVGMIGEVPDDASQSDVIALESGLSTKEVVQVQAFFAYNDRTCLSIDPGEVPSATPGE